MKQYYWGKVPQGKENGRGEESKRKIILGSPWKKTVNKLLFGAYY